MSVKKLKLAINHRSCPQLGPLELIDLSEKLGISAVELRIDIKENSITNMAMARTVARYAEEKEIKILTINALYPFNIWNKEREDDTQRLADLCNAVGAKALVCCPLVSDRVKFSEDEQLEKACDSLFKISPILKSRSLVGHVEPLGFPISTLRKKEIALNAIDDSGTSDVFNILHDTFHHAGAQEVNYYAKRTGLVHLSSVVDKSLDMDDLLDAHRFFVQENDITYCLNQIRELIRRGYNDYFSIEPFADEILGYPNPASVIHASIGYINRSI